MGKMNIYESPDKGATIRQRPFHQPMKQIKSQWYYIFWGSMAVAVVGGQVYVGTGYREMARASRDTSTVVTCLPPYQIPVQPYRNKTGEFE